ncbi:hypothetical protein EWW49_35955, partial [Pseudomonas syringae]
RPGPHRRDLGGPSFPGPVIVFPCIEGLHEFVRGRRCARRFTIGRYRSYVRYLFCLLSGYLPGSIRAGSG